MSITDSHDQTNPAGNRNDDGDPTCVSQPAPGLAWLAVGTFALGTESFVIAGVLPQIADDLDVGRPTAGLSGGAVRSHLRRLGPDHEHSHFSSQRQDGPADNDGALCCRQPGRCCRTDRSQRCWQPAWPQPSSHQLSRRPPQRQPATSRALNSEVEPSPWSSVG